MTDFKPEDHPRADGGQWTEKPQSSSEIALANVSEAFSIPGESKEERSARFAKLAAGDEDTHASELSYWEAMGSAQDAVDEPAPESYNEFQRRGYDSVTVDLSDGLTLEYRARMLQLAAASADDRTAERRKSNDPVVQARKDLYWDARATRLRDLSKRLTELSASDDDEDRECRSCGEPNDDGEGSDGLCGNCADRHTCEECYEALDEDRDNEDDRLCAECRAEQGN